MTAVNRLQEAREYVGVTIREAADFVGISVPMLQDFEAGRAEPINLTVDKLARLYRRPASWLRGGYAPPVQISAELDVLMEPLSDHDRSEVVAFVEWLQHGKESNPT